MLTFYCKDESSTKNFGKKLGVLLNDGDVLCLDGDLGAGKTCLAKAIAISKGVDEKEVTSPTFTIMNVYQGKNIEIRHFDLYRINRAEELLDIGFSEYVGYTGISLIEWGSLFSEELPEELLKIEIKNKDTGREITLVPFGQRYESICEKVQNC